jgi:ferredoxin
LNINLFAILIKFNWKNKPWYTGDDIMKYKIEIERGGCIACGTCYSLDPEHFEPSENRKSQVVAGETNASGSTGIFEDDDIENVRVAEDSCPASVITVTEL